MTDDDPVWARGAWRCLLCDQTGSGGAAGFHRHYVAHHYREG